MTKKDVVYRNLETLQERARNLGHLLRTCSGDFETTSEMLFILHSMKLNLSVMEESIKEIKEWKGNDHVSER
jgi:hypothetical protein